MGGLAFIRARHGDSDPERPWKAVWNSDKGFSWVVRDHQALGGFRFEVIDVSRSGLGALIPPGAPRGLPQAGGAAASAVGQSDPLVPVLEPLDMKPL